MTDSSNFRKHAGWWLLALSACTYAVGIYLTGRYLCEPIGPNVLMAGVVIGAISFLALLATSITRRSIATGIGAVAAALLVLVLAFASIGLTLPGCAGV